MKNSRCLTLSLFRGSASKGRKKLKAAIIGFPGSGKTTLLTMLLNDIMLGRIRGVTGTVRGESSIGLLCENLNKIENGIPVGALTDPTKLACTADIEIGKQSITVEFGDYPHEGQASITAANNPNWLSGTPYFQWVKDADVFYFVIDTTISLLSNVYYSYSLSDIITGYRAAWMQIQENSDFEKGRRLRPLNLVFSKLDIIEAAMEQYPHLVDMGRDDRVQQVKYSPIYDELLEYSGMGEPSSVPFIKVCNGELSEEFYRKVIEKDFKELLDFCRAQSRNTNVILGSSVMTRWNEESKMGMAGIIKHLW